MKQLLLTGAALLAIAPAAFAQSSSDQPSNRQSSNIERASSSAPEVRQQLSNNLRQMGYTDIHVVPESFFVQAKDKSGNPVMMFINPNSMTMVTAAQSQDTNYADNTNTNTTTNAYRADNGSNSVSQSTFTQIPSQDELSSHIVGLGVYNNDNQDIAKIKDVAFDSQGMKAYILSVGGALGMGGRYVAVRPSAVNISCDNNNKCRAEMNANADDLKSAPEYKYSSND